MIHRPPRRDTHRVVASLSVVLVLTLTMLGTHGRAGAAPAGTLLVVGDSLTVGASVLGKFSGSERTVRASWKKVVVEAKVGRTARQGASIVATRVRSTRATAVMVALGTNDLMGRRTAREARALIDAVMSAAGSRPVLWVNIEFGTLPARERPARARMFNTELRRASTRWPNLRIADWNRSFTPKGRSRFLADGVHLTTSGYGTRAEFYAREAASFRTWIDTVLNSTTTTSSTTTSTTSTVPESTTTVETTSTTTTDPSSSTTSSAP